jgi:hypothetical protein
VCVPCRHPSGALIHIHAVTCARVYLFICEERWLPHVMARILKLSYTRLHVSARILRNIRACTCVRTYKTEISAHTQLHAHAHVHAHVHVHVHVQLCACTCAGAYQPVSGITYAPTRARQARVYFLYVQAHCVSPLDLVYRPPSANELEARIRQQSMEACCWRFSCTK